MKAAIKKGVSAAEYETDERCFIAEVANDSDDGELSIARARLAAGVTTAWHRLEGVAERYLIISGQGRVEIEGVETTEVSSGDVVRIPSGIAQRITNIGEFDLLFYCICTPRFTPSCYYSLEID